MVGETGWVEQSLTKWECLDGMLMAFLWFHCIGQVLLD